MPEWPFVDGRLYSRADIHKAYGGQERGGIATPAHHPLVLAFTGSEGSKHGYSDERLADGSWRYFGEGQSGDMVLKRGNLAIAHHSTSGRDLLLFQTTGKGKPVRFLGQFICGAYDVEDAPDRDGFRRKAIVFNLVPFQAAREQTDLTRPQVANDPTAFENLRRLAYAAAQSPGKQTKQRSVYERSTIIRDYALARASGECECCGADAPFTTSDGLPFLEVHHLRRLTDGGPDSPDGVAALCPNCHRELHYGVHGVEKNAQLRHLIAQVERRTFAEIFPGLKAGRAT
jgi:5-methylcytosine-specific restriction protein A